MVVVKLIGLKSHVRMLPCEGCICDLTKSHRWETKKMLPSSSGLCCMLFIIVLIVLHA